MLCALLCWLPHAICLKMNEAMQHTVHHTHKVIIFFNFIWIITKCNVLWIAACLSSMQVNWKIYRILCCAFSSVWRCGVDGCVEDQNKAPYFVGVFIRKITQNERNEAECMYMYSHELQTELYRWFMRFLHVRSHIVLLRICNKLHCMLINTMCRRIECLYVIPCERS